MRCKACDYPLWSLRARHCPECGREFLPSEFDFAPNAVRFGCPHCDQPYYGTDERGHLVPRSFTCVSCARVVDMDEMVLLPGEGVDERLATVPLLPWLDKRKRRTAGWRTIGMAMAQPRLMMDVTPVESSVGRAWWFYTLVMLLVSVLGGGGFAFFGIGLAVGGFTGGAVAGILLGVAAWVALIFGGMAVWGMLAHGLIRVLGPAPAHSLGRTYQALCYSSGVLMPAAIPCVGAYILPLALAWWGVSASLALGRAQGVRGARVWIGAGLPLWLLVAAMAALVIVPFAIAFGSMGTIHASMGAMNAQSVHSALVAHASMNGAPPSSGAELLAADAVTPFELLRPDAWSGGSIAGTTPADWSRLSPAEKWEIADGVAESLAPDWAAHRLGDIVFTYNGIDLLAPVDPGLWVLIDAPPAARAASSQHQSVRVVLADGSVERIDPGDFSGALDNQNALRARHALAPLPHPGDVPEIGLDGLRGSDADGDR